MKKTIIALLVLTILIAAVPFSAMAASRYCGPCNKTLTWKACCYGTQYAASNYGVCGDYPNCNWYTQWKYDGEKCPTSGCTNKFRLSTHHACKGFHTVTNPVHTYSWCPY